MEKRLKELTLTIVAIVRLYKFLNKGMVFLFASIQVQFEIILLEILNSDYFFVYTQ